ncbi:MFS transporter [Streptomyces sp. NPDC056716]|uniref:MFS transporter n=1 Tax=unclassified Streptomyces TaxID=2593676 RepID=UPI00368A7E64
MNRSSADDARRPKERMPRPVLYVIVLCALVALMDGYDTQAIALAAPDIGADWNEKPSAFGLVFGIGLFGGLIGATAAGWVGDRVGRRPVVLFGVAVFGLLTVLTPALGTSLAALEWLRFFTGLGLGAAVPGIISLASEYAPAHSKATVVSWMWCGFPLGGVLSGVLSAALIPDFGWKSLFYIGGVGPLILLVLLWFKLPESARFLQVRGDTARAAEIFARLGVTDHTGAPTAPAPQPAGGSRFPVLDLFRQGRGTGTALLWTAMALTLLMVYFLATWLPTIAPGDNTRGALLAVATLNLGSVAGCMLISRLADRYSATRVIAVCYALGAIAIALIGEVGSSTAGLLGITFVAGFFAVGAQLCTVALCATYYETRLRATGVGWSIAAGRLGAIFGPTLGAALIGAGVGVSALFQLAGAVALCTGLVVFLVGFVHKSAVTVPSGVPVAAGDEAKAMRRPGPVV